jgi:hypothetical protein
VAARDRRVAEGVREVVEGERRVAERLERVAEGERRVRKGKTGRPMLIEGWQREIERW